MMLYLVLAQVLSANESMTLATPEPVAFPHFPTPLHAFVWRNWQLVPAARMAEVVGASVEEIVALGGRMGLSGPPDITEDQQRRSYVTVIRRNWHLLPLEQLQALLGWTRQHLEYILREDDFLFIKLGILKPRCAPLRFVEATAQTREREQQIARWAAESFPQGVGLWEEPLFQFVNDLSAPAPELPAHNKGDFLSPRFCYSYFAPYGDPLLNPELDPYPDGLLARLANVGVNGVWLQAVLYTLAPFPWDPERSEGYEKRLASLRHLVERAKKHGIGVYLYLNEPRAMPLSFFEEHPELKGAVDVREKTHASLCTSVPEVRDYMRNAVAAVCREVPDIAGFFTITFSENWTHCWAHSHETKQAASGCPRCAKRAPEEVIAEVNATIYNGVKDAESSAQVIVWDWVWPSEWIPGIIERLPEGVKVMSVSEWDKPITVGGVQSVCGEYSLSVVGPGPRALRTWDLARRRGLATLAKVQATRGKSPRFPISPWSRTQRAMQPICVKRPWTGLWRAGPWGAIPRPVSRCSTQWSTRLVSLWNRPCETLLSGVSALVWRPMRCARGKRSAAPSRRFLLTAHCSTARLCRRVPPTRFGNSLQDTGRRWSATPMTTLTHGAPFFPRKSSSSSSKASQMALIWPSVNAAAIPTNWTSRNAGRTLWRGRWALQKRAPFIAAAAPTRPPLYWRAGNLRKQAIRTE